MGWLREDPAAGPRIPELDRAAEAGHGDSPAVRAVGEVVDAPAVPRQQEPLGVALALQIPPLPEAPVALRAGVEQLLQPAEVAVPPGEPGRGDLLEIERRPEPVAVPEAHGHPHRHQHRQQADHAERRLGGPAPSPEHGPLPEPDPPRQDRLVCEEPPQVFGQVVGGLVAPGGILFDRLEHDRLQVTGDVWIQPSRAGRFLSLDQLNEPEPVRRLKGGPEPE